MAKKLSDLGLKPRNVDEQGAGLIVGKVTLFQRMVSHGWIAPIIAKHSCTLFSEFHVQVCCDLLEQGYFPGERDPDFAVIAAAKNGVYKSSYAT